jgi:hypothetical protein
MIDIVLFFFPFTALLFLFVAMAMQKNHSVVKEKNNDSFDLSF